MIGIPKENQSYLHGWGNDLNLTDQLFNVQEVNMERHCLIIGVFTHCRKMTFEVERYPWLNLKWWNSLSVQRHQGILVLSDKFSKSLFSVKCCTSMLLMVTMDAWSDRRMRWRGLLTALECNDITMFLIRGSYKICLLDTFNIIYLNSAILSDSFGCFFSLMPRA